MRRLIAFILLIVLSFSLFADPIVYEYEPYEEEEFPIWSHELRRAESIFFGSFVITLPVSMLIYNIAAYCGMPTFDEEYKNFLVQAGVAASLSLTISLTDWIIGKSSD